MITQLIEVYTSPSSVIIPEPRTAKHTRNLTNFMDVMIIHKYRQKVT